MDGREADGGAAYAGRVAADLDALLEAAVAGVEGTERPGQVEMAHAVADAVEAGEHLLVQAGTGTGKSLAYLVPAVRHAMESGKPAVVATATLALQAQIVDRDMPRVASALEPLLGRRPTYALVKGRRNYLCAHKLEGGFPDEDDALLAVDQVSATASGSGPRSSGCGSGRTRRRRATATSWSPESATGRGDRCPCRRTSASAGSAR